MPSGAVGSVAVLLLNNINLRSCRPFCSPHSNARPERTPLCVQSSYDHAEPSEAVRPALGVSAASSSETD